MRRRTREKKEELSDWSLASRMPQTLLPAPPERERRGSKVGDPGERWSGGQQPVDPWRISKEGPNRGSSLFSPPLEPVPTVQSFHVSITPAGCMTSDWRGYSDPFNGGSSHGSTRVLQIPTFR